MIQINKVVLYYLNMKSKLLFCTSSFSIGRLHPLVINFYLSRAYAFLAGASSTQRACDWGQQSDN